MIKQYFVQCSRNNSSDVQKQLEKFDNTIVRGSAVVGSKAILRVETTMNPSIIQSMVGVLTVEERILHYPS